ncbi:MAG: hypothetical protein WCX84_05340 [Syntrophales bacterium]|jgi:hypothetical protein|nr:hypothetical protein [Syntrophales bacterium]
MGKRCKRYVIWFGSDEKAKLHLLEAWSRWPEPLSIARDPYSCVSAVHHASFQLAGWQAMENKDSVFCKENLLQSGKHVGHEGT